MRSTGFRRTFVAIGVCSALTLAATACGPGDDASAGGKTRITVNCEPPRSAKVDRSFFEEDVASFEKRNPDIDVVAHDAFPCQDPKTFDAKLAGGRWRTSSTRTSPTPDTSSTSTRPRTSRRT